MPIIKKSVHIIDYEAKKVYHRNIPGNFDEYITELVDFIKSNSNTRPFKSTSDSTQVILETRRILKSNDIDENSNSFETIAKKLLDAEIDVQKSIGHLTNVKKGSLIQALIFDPFESNYSFLLAKIEHSDFIDDNDFSFKTGFSKDKKNIWKSCIIDLSNPIDNIYYSEIYSDTSAKYWNKKFLEFVEQTSDENNTSKSFTETEKVLKRNLKKRAPKDFELLRNNLIGYYRTHPFITYRTMVNEIFNNYVPCDSSSITSEALKNTVATLNELPEKKGFDAQFNSIPKELKAKMKHIFKVFDGIEVKVMYDIDSKTIRSAETSTGERLILIKTNNSEIFNTYYDENIKVIIDGD